MLNRTNRITSFLIGAASVFSIMPTNAMAADKLSDTAGQIKKAEAYKEGKFYIDGEPKNKDEDVYYLNNGSYSELKDIDNDSEIAVYGSKYLKIDDGDTYVNLSNGQVVDDKVEEDEKDAASEKLRKQIKDDNDGRYNENDGKNYQDLEVIPGNKFSENYYKCTYKTKEAKNSINGNANEFNVYTDASGKYIDADYNVGSVRVKLDGNTNAKVQNTNEEEKGVRVSVADAKEIGQDNSYIYRIVNMTVNSLEADKKIEEINGIEIGNNSDF